MPSILDDPPRIAIGPGSRQHPLARFALIGDVHAEDERLGAAGWSVLRFWEHEDPILAADRVEAALG